MALKFIYLGLKFAHGRHTDNSNHLQWDTVIHNLPRSKDFKPILPWVIKKCGRVMESFIFGDLRIMGVDLEVAWSITIQILSILQYLGVQDAPRKTRPT